MLFTRLALASTALFSVALAQATVAFTSVPAIAEAGETYNITWGGGNGDPVTLTLRKGDPNDLDTIAILADGLTGDSYEWKVDEDLEDGSDYALQIQQGLNKINYSGLFTVSGGQNSSSSSASSTATSSRNTTSTTSSESSSTTNGTSSTTESSNSTASSTTSESSTSETSSVSTTTGSQSSRTGSATGVASVTSAPDSGSGAVELGSSVAFAMAVLGAVVMMN